MDLKGLSWHVKNALSKQLLLKVLFWKCFAEGGWLLMQAFECLAVFTFSIAKMVREMGC